MVNYIPLVTPSKLMSSKPYTTRHDNCPLNDQIIPCLHTQKRHGATRARRFDRIWCFITAAYISYGDVTELYLLYENGLVKIGIAAGSVLLGLYFQNLYAELRVRSLFLLLQQVLMVISVVFLIQALLAYLNADVVVSRRLMIIAAALTVALFPPWRKLYTNVLYKGFGIERLLFLGTDVTGAEIAEELVQKPELGFTGVGFIDDKSEPGSVVAGGLHVLGPLARSLKSLQRRGRIGLLLTWPSGVRYFRWICFST